MTEALDGGSAEQPSSLGGDEQALRAELQQVREAVVAQWESGDAVQGGELIAGCIGVLLLVAGLVLVGTGLALGHDLDPYPAALIVGVPCCVGAWFGLRPMVHRRVIMYREVRALRRRERALLTRLPAGDTGPGVYRQYYTRRFGSPAVLILYAAFGLVMLLLVLS